jgi:hypothetical protein
VSSPPILVWTSWSPANSSSKGASTRGVVFCPGPSFQIRNAGRDAGSFKAVTGRPKIVFSKVYFGLDDGEFVAEVLESVILVAVALQFSGGIPVVEVSDGVTECVEGGGWSDKECVEPYGEGFGDVRR